MRRLTASRAIGLFAALALIAATTSSAAAARFEISFPAAAEASAITGRLLVIISPRPDPEPRLGLRPTNPVGYREDRGVALFGRDVEALEPGQRAVVDAGAQSYPLGLHELPAGDYHVQAVLVRYTHVKRADGHKIWVPITDRRVNPHSSNMAGPEKATTGTTPRGPKWCARWRSS